MHDPVAGDLATKDAWKQFSKTTPFLGVPPEIHLKLFGLLNPIDAVCLSLVKYVFPTPLSTLRSLANSSQQLHVHHIPKNHT